MMPEVSPEESSGWRAGTLTPNILYEEDSKMRKQLSVVLLLVACVLSACEVKFELRSEMVEIVFE